MIREGDKKGISRTGESFFIPHVTFRLKSMNFVKFDLLFDLDL